MRYLLSALLILTGSAFAQGPPAGWYNSVDDTNATTLRTTLHDRIDDHQRFSYTGGSTDTWDILKLAQEDPNNSTRIIDVYRNRSFAKSGGSYNREHTWPKSYGFPDDGSDNYPYTDCHMLFLSDSGYNTARSNRPFRNCTSSCGEYLTDGGTAGTYPGTSCWGTGSFTSGTWQVWSERKGDVARALLYADIRYEGGNHGTTGISEPDLILTDNQSLLAASNTGNNESVAYMGMLSVLLQWHQEDPVDASEVLRNDVVFSYQGNRNPFVDHPEWVDCLFSDNCGGTGGPFGTVFCSPAVTNSTGNPAIIHAAGSIVAADNDLTLSASQLPPNQFGYFLSGRSVSFVPNPGGSQGILCLGGAIGRFNAGPLIRYSGPFGFFMIPVDLTQMPTSPVQPALAGQTWTFQCWYRDINPGTTSNFTDAIEFVFQ
ncbi:MAG: endonuclease [Planctomycetota bacterium]|nr:endonuclease [Planctomycetota bacterium]